jgi:hypothetical protein
MAIPRVPYPVPKTIRKVFTKSGGFQLPQSSSIPTKLIQGTPNNPAVQSVQLIRGTGSLAIDAAQFLGKDTLDLLVPITGITTPFQPSQPVTISSEAPVISLPPGLAVTSVIVTPHIKNTFAGPHPLAAKTLSPGTNVQQFLVRVQIQLTKPLRTAGAITVGVAINLHA